MKISFEQFEQQLTADMDGSYTLGPMLRASNSLHVFADDYLENEFRAFWTAYKFAENLVYIPGSGMCEEFSLEALVKFKRAVRKLYRGEDTIAAACEFRGFIGPKAINGVKDSAHSNICVATTKDQVTWQNKVWEPQNENWILLSDAHSRGFRPMCYWL